MTEITAQSHSDAQRKLKALEAENGRLKAARTRDTLLVAAATELVAADRAVNQLAEQSCRGIASGTIAMRLAVVDRLRRAQKRMGELAGIIT